MAEFIQNMILFLISAWFIIDVSYCLVSVNCEVSVAQKWYMQMVHTISSVMLKSWFKNYTVLI